MSGVAAETLLTQRLDIAPQLLARVQPDAAKIGNRVLNATRERVSPKDRFADHLLQRLGLPEGPTTEERDGDMTVHIAL